MAKYLCYPNNADKFRQTGPYRIDRCAEFVDHVFTQHRGFKLVWQLAFAYLGYQLLAVAVAASLFLHGWISGYALAAAVVFQLLFGYWAMIPVSNSCPFFGAKFLSFLLYIPMLRQGDHRAQLEELGLVLAGQIDGGLETGAAIGTPTGESASGRRAARC